MEVFCSWIIFFGFIVWGVGIIIKERDEAFNGDKDIATAVTSCIFIGIAALLYGAGTFDGVLESLRKLDVQETTQTSEMLK